MKRLIVFCLAIVLAGCFATTQPVIKGPQEPHEIIVRVESATDQKVEVSKPEGEVIHKSMVVEDETEKLIKKLSSNTRVVGEVAYIKIIGTIWGSSSSEFKTDLDILEQLGAKKLHFYINSGGGSAIDGLAYADEILNSTKRGFTTVMDGFGIIASAAVPIFVVGQERMCSASTLFMIHPGKLFKWGMFAEGIKDLKEQQRMMEVMDRNYNVFMKKYTKLPDEIITSAKESDTYWFFADDAIKYGMVDRIH